MGRSIIIHPKPHNTVTIMDFHTTLRPRVPTGVDTLLHADAAIRSSLISGGGGRPSERISFSVTVCTC